MNISNKVYTLYLFVNIHLFEWIMQLAYRSLYIYIVPKKNLRIYIIKVGWIHPPFSWTKKKRLVKVDFDIITTPSSSSDSTTHNIFFFTEI